jgi:hypothetical protein
MSSSNSNNNRAPTNTVNLPPTINVQLAAHQRHH